jgi:hypothetical protein
VPDARVVAVGVGLVGDQRIDRVDPCAGDVAVQIVRDDEGRTAEDVARTADQPALGVSHTAHAHGAVQTEVHAGERAGPVRRA